MSDGPNGCTCGFNGDCNCPFVPGAGDALVIESDAPEAEEAQPRKRRKSSTSPTKRTLAECRKRGWTVQVVERYNPYSRTLLDLFGVIDLVAIALTSIGRGNQILGIQACSGADHARRRDKILAEPRARQWVEAGGRLELWSWSKRGGRNVTRKLWTLRVETYEEMVVSAQDDRQGA
jgi:hypothetical protein